MRRVPVYFGAVVLTLSFAFHASGAEPYDRPYDGLQAGADAAARHEARRLAEIRHQLDTIELMKWYSGLPPGNEGAFFYYGTAPRFSPDPRRPWFGPWMPYLVGGVPYAAIAPQSIGQRQIQTGPNRWESHPVYAPPQPFPIGGPPRPIIEPTRPERLPEPGVGSGPREF